MPKIRVLPPETARLIAAGEVIDRPAAVLREFLDNALDSGASEIAVEIAGGGAELVRVVDDGCGMGREDLELAALPHATSKIAAADDLLTARSLGFRGEALASIAAAARLEITSRDAESGSAFRLVAGPGLGLSVQAVPGRRGSSAEASRLFENFPARKQFLKRAQAESAICRQIFVDKALAHPSVGFRYSSEGRLGLILPPASPEERVLACYAEPPRDLVYRVRFSGEGFEGSVVLAGPAFYRNDRRLMQVFINRRRIQDGGLLQALDYAFSGFLPGGAHPCAFLFAEVDPALADFNIHPAKREVRFKDPDGLRRSFVRATQGFLGELARREPDKARPSLEAAPELAPWAASGRDTPGIAEHEREGAEAPGALDYAGAETGFGGGPRQGAGGGQKACLGASWDDLAAFRERAAPLPRPEPAPGAPRYLGKALGLFLVVEAEGALYLID
ncbi:MAG: ATP-binding protein, partial [Spirochaetaceae bacterium]|nr:ATP-binding protein [Spirochaetaceae bacterium]